MRKAVDAPGPALLRIVAATFFAHAGSALVLAAATGRPLLQVEIWSHARPYRPECLPFALLFGVSGIGVALVVPGLPWAAALARRSLSAPELFYRAFAIDVVQATAFVAAWKALTGHAPPRGWFLAWQAAVAMSGLLALARRPRRRMRPTTSVRYLAAAALLTLVLLPALLWNAVCVEDASGDGTEAFEFSRSLATHQLPHWDLENGFYGFYPQFMLFAYPAHLSLLTLGETEGAQRLPGFLYVFGLSLILAELARCARPRLRGVDRVLLLGATAWFVLYHAHAATYEAVVDLAEPFGTDAFFTFLAASACHALLTRQRSWWAAFALAGAMALPSGLPFALLLLAGRLLARRRSIRWPGLRGLVLDLAAVLGPWLAYSFLVDVHSTFQPVGVTKWSAANLLHLYAWDPEPGNAVAIVAHLALAVGAVPLLGLLAVGHREQVVRALATSWTAYLVLLGLFGRLHPHYLTPVSAFLPAMLVRLVGGRIGPQPGRLVRAAYGATLAGLLAAGTAFADRPPHAAYRKFGTRTLFLYDAYPEAVGAANLLVDDLGLAVTHPLGRPLPWETPQLPAGDVPWGISHHTWLRYSGRVREEDREYDQIVVGPHRDILPPAGFRQRALPEGWTLYYHPERSAFAHPRR